ncbi:MAG: hypothetical protein ACOCSE_01235 [Chitinivibrionales bacterium]
MKFFKTAAVSAMLISGILISRVSAQNTGSVTYTLHRESNPTQDQEEAYSMIESAMDSAVGYYNRYTEITKTLNVYYNTDVPTAEANFNGTISFGSNRSYMVVHTAMHEIAHTVGIGTTQEYWDLMQDGVFTGTHATEVLRDITGDPEDVINGDSQHFWPYGLNHADEVDSEEDLINHCRIVNGIHNDLFNEEFYRECRLRSKYDGRCMRVSEDNNLVLGSCEDSASVVRMIALNGESVFRLEFGNQVLDIPNESPNPGATAGLYSWNGGDHQKAVFEFDTSGSGEDLARISMLHSGLYLIAEGNNIIQGHADASVEKQYWELVDINVDINDNASSATKFRKPQNTAKWISVMESGVAIKPSTFGINSAELKVVDLQGRIIRSKSVDKDIILSTEGFAAGIYLFNLYHRGDRIGKHIVVP